MKKMKKYSQYVSREQVQQIHEESMKILGEVGVKFEHPKALELFKKHGARVENEIVYLDEALVNKAIELCPEGFELYSQKGSIKLGDGSRLNMPACGCVYVEDHQEIRRMRNEDTINILKLASTSPTTDYNYMDYFADTSKFTKEQKIYSNVGMLLKYSPQIACFDPDTFSVPHDQLFDATVKSIKIIKQFEGVEEQNRYVNSFCVNSLSPLCYDFAPLEKMFAFCSEEQPIWFTPCAMPALTSP
ncbi:MAG: trimethylamine methyltransferase family protein, partial [Eubacterium sp.]